MSSDKGGGGGQKTKDYYGSVAGVICAGPVDELVAVIIDEATVWPTRKVWNDAVTDVEIDFVKRTSGIGFVQTLTPHGLRPGNKFQVSGTGTAMDGTHTVPQPSATISGPVNYVTSIRIQFPNAGPDIAATGPAGSKLQKVLHYAVNVIVRDGAAVWECVLAHDAIDTTRPPNATYWQAYSVTRALSANPYTFTVSGYGRFDFYWGTNAQVLAGDSVMGKNGHPPYRNQAWIEMHDILFGTERQGPPNVAVVVRKKPQQALIAGGAADLDAEMQANPMAALAELATDPIFGIGLDAGRLDATTWQAVADALAGDSGRTYLSPIVDTGIKFRDFVSALLAYYDGWLRFNGSGVIEAGRFLHNEAPPAFTADTTIDFHDCVNEVEWDANGWAGTFNEVLCRFQDRLRAFKDAGMPSNSAFNRRVVGEPRRAKLERQWITRQQQASDHAAEWGKIYAQPDLAPQLVVRAEKAESIKPGDLFLLTHDAVELSVVCRCNQKTYSAPPVGTVTVDCQSERGLAPLPFQPTTPAPGGTALPPAETVTLYRFVQPPTALIEVGRFQLTVLAARTSELTRGLRPWLKVDDAALFYQLGEQKKWAVAATLDANYAAATAALDDDSENLHLNLADLTLQADLDAISVTQTDDAIGDDSLLLWIFHSATQFEIMTVKSIRLNAGVYKLKVRRGRFGTKPIAFTAGDDAWIFFREDVVAYTHGKFNVFVQAGTAATFRLQAFTSTEEADVSSTDECPNIAFNFTDQHLPVVTWQLHQKKAVGDPDFADIGSFAVFFASTTQFRFSFDVFATNGQIADVQLVGRIGNIEEIVGQNQFIPQQFVVGLCDVFTFPRDGTWELHAVVTEVSGRVTKHEMTIGGVQKLLIGSAAKVQSVLCDPPGGGFNGLRDISGLPYVAISLSCPTAGATIFWTLTFPDASPAGGSWINYTSVPVTAIGLGGGWLGLATRVVLWLYATKGGLTDSEVVRYEFWWDPTAAV